MRVTFHNDAAAFWETAGPLYGADPVLHTAAITVTHLLLDGIGFGSDKPVLGTVHDGGRAVGAFLCTPPFPLGVSALPDETIDVAAAALHDEQIPVTSVVGPLDRADAFTAAWRKLTGARTTTAMAMRCYRLDDLVEPESTGVFRLATEADVELLGHRMNEFMMELGMRNEGDDYVQRVAKMMAAGRAYGIVEVDGEPVASASASQILNGMSRVSAVYTPPEHRFKGYATHATAGISRWARGAGAEHVLLFTDLDNPTSNSIYQKIGYVPVYDGMEYQLSPA